ncbi:MAG: hypothetical protein QG620_569 [Patescibacteria group bacterium]|nr:hypothetical protein [Patescibacteria group bacterium]
MNEVKPKILIVEDDKFLTDIYKNKFSSQGFEVKIINTPDSKFIDDVVNFQPSIIVVGIILPNVDGYQMTEMLKKDERTKEIKVVGFDNLSDEESKRKAISAGMEDYFQHSDISPENFVNKIKSLL